MLFCSAPETSVVLFFSLFHSLPCQRNEASAAAPQGSSCLLPYNNFRIHWPNPSQFESQWGSQSYSALSYVVRQLRGLLLLHQRKATELTPSRSPQWGRETLETVLILLLRSSPDTNTALLSSCCSAGTCHCTQSLVPLLQLSPVLCPSPGETSATFVWGQVFTWDGRFALLIRSSRDCLLCNTRF